MLLEAEFLRNGASSFPHASWRRSPAPKNAGGADAERFVTEFVRFWRCAARRVEEGVQDPNAYHTVVAARLCYGLFDFRGQTFEDRRRA